MKSLLQLNVDLVELRKITQTLADTYGLNRTSMIFIDGQVIDVGEEAGEFLGAFRRWTGRARRGGTQQEVGDEFADVLIAACIAADLCGIDMQAALDHKYEKVMTRGWKN